MLLDADCNPKDIDLQVIGSKDVVMAQLKKRYAEAQLTSNPIAIVVGTSTESMDAIDVRTAVDKYFMFDYIENNVNCLLFDLKTDRLLDMSGTGISDCLQKKFRIPATSMRTWNEFPEPPRKYNGKLIRVLKMLAKGFTFAEETQKNEFIGLFEEFFDAHCEPVIAGKFSAFQMVLGQTVRGDVLNFEDGTVLRGQGILYGECLEALRTISCDLCAKLEDHMGTTPITMKNGCYCFGNSFVLPASTLLIKDEAIGKKLRTLPEMQKITASLSRFPLLVVGGAVRDLLTNSDIIIPKDVDFQIVGDKDNIMEVLKKNYAEKDLKSNPIAIVVGESTEKLDAFDVRSAMCKYYNFNYIENDVNSLMYDLNSNCIIDITGTGVENNRKRKFSIVAEDLDTWHSFPEPPRAMNGKAPRALKMLAKGYTFADDEQKDAYVRLLRKTFEDHCKLVNAGKFSTYQMVLGQTVRGDRLNFTDGSITAGSRPLYDKCIEALASLDADLAKKVVTHMMSSE